MKTRMTTTELGSTGLQITRVGFGAWAIGGGGYDGGWGPQDDEDSIAAIHHALALGVNWIDTAAHYGFGHSERVIGRALAGVEPRPYVFTKGGLPEGPGRTKTRSLRRDSLLREVEGSLERLGVEAIDLYQIHWPIPDEEIEEGWSTLAELKERGVVRHIGVSNFNVQTASASAGHRAGGDPAAAVLADRPPDRSGAPPLRRAGRDRDDRVLADGLRPALRRHDAGADRGAARGRLAPSATSEFREPQLTQNLELVERLRRVAARHDTTPGAVAVAWTLRNPAVNGAIAGFRRPEQVDPIVAAANLSWTSRTSPRSKGAAEMAASRPQKIGFVGLGHMGGTMAARFLAAGWQVYGEERSRERAQDLVDQGLQWCDTPREVAKAAEVVFTSIPDDDALQTVGAGPSGILEGLTPGKVWVDLSTVSPRASREMAGRVREQGAAMLDAPVSGSVPQVQSGTLTIMVGGDEEAYARVEPVLEVLGTPTRVGENGQGLALKLAINISLAVQMLAFSEGLLLAARDGVDPKVASDVMTQSAIGSPMLKLRAPLVLDLPQEAWFDVGLMRKDIRLALAMAKDLGLGLPSAAAAVEVLDKAVELGYERRDIAALYEVLAQTSGGRPEE